MRGILAVGAAISLSACTQSQYTTTQHTQTAPAPIAQPAENPWQPGETRSFQTSIGVTTAIRRGKTSSGSSYSYYPDGSGSLTNGSATWSFSCKVDKINDQKKCEITNRHIDLFINYGSSASPRWICSIKHDFPGRTGAIRVDNNKAMTTDTDGCIPGSRINQLLAGNSITIRSVEWPYDYDRDSTGPLSGLKDTIDLVSHIRTNLSKINF